MAEETRPTCDICGKTLEDFEYEKTYSGDYLTNQIVFLPRDMQMPTHWLHICDMCYRSMVMDLVKKPQVSEAL